MMTATEPGAAFHHGLLGSTLAAMELVLLTPPGIMDAQSNCEQWRTAQHIH
jgi:hypothetical protein